MTIALLGIVGAGAFGREVLEYVTDAAGKPRDCDEVVFVVEGEHDRADVHGHRVLHVSEFLAHPGPRRFTIAIAQSLARERLANALEAGGAVSYSVVSQQSLVLRSASLGPGSIVCPFAMVSADAIVGRHVHVNVNTYVAHDCRIGDWVTFAPAVTCNGWVEIGRHAYIGAGASLKNGGNGRPLRIGEGAVVGMGAVVIRDVAAFTTVVGVPARPLPPSVKET